MDGIYVVTVEASPLPGSDRFFEFGGAYINVYTASRTEVEAITVATRESLESGWQPEAIDRVQWVTRADFADTEDALEYFERALQDGIVVVVHTFPPETDDVGAAH